MHQVEITVNGQAKRAEVASETTLLSILRDSWGLTGSKLGCDVGDCGACTVLVDGLSVTACLVLAVQADGRQVLTIEGLGGFEYLHPVQAAFERLSSIQCGFCAPGIMISAKALIDSNPHPTEAEIREALAGNLCRCTGYTKIIEGIAEACRDGAAHEQSA